MTFPLIPLLRREATQEAQYDMIRLEEFPLIPLLRREATIEEMFLLVSEICFH